MRACRFVVGQTLPTMAIVAAFGLLITFGAAMPGVPGGIQSFCGAYYSVIPMIGTLICFIQGAAVSNQLNTAIAMGARRKDMLVALQGEVLFCAVAASVILFIRNGLPQLFGWESPRASIGLVVSGSNELTYFLLCVALILGGMISTTLMARHKVVGVILLIVMIMGLLILPLMWTIGLLGGIAHTTITWICVGVIVVAEIILARFVSKYVVRG